MREFKSRCSTAKFNGKNNILVYFSSIWMELASSWFITSLQEHTEVPILFSVSIFGSWRKPVLHAHFHFFERAKSRELCRLCFWRRRLRGSRGLLAKSEAKLLKCRVVKNLDVFWNHTQNTFQSFLLIFTEACALGRMVPPPFRARSRGSPGGTWGRSISNRLKAWSCIW